MRRPFPCPRLSDIVPRPVITSASRSGPSHVPSLSPPGHRVAAGTARGRTGPAARVERGKHERDEGTER